MSTPRDRIEAKLGLAGPPLRHVRDAPPCVPDHNLIRRIGQGSYGEVWLARNALGTWRAVKIVYRDNFKDARPYEREFAGIRSFEPLSRANEGLVDILQVGRDDGEGWFYYVMELADDVTPVFQPATTADNNAGGATSVAASPTGKSALQPATYEPRTLSRDLHQRGRLPLEDCLQLSLTLSLALGHLHRHGLIHRDVKPSNIIFVGGVPKSADIGLVTQAADANTFVGTEGFVPPEGPTSPQADIYALGKVLYEAAMGKDRNEFPEPFTQIGTDRESVALMELNTILLRACAPDPKGRYASAEEMHADLALLHSGGSVKRRHQFDRQFQVAKQVGAVAIVATVLVGAAWFWQRQQTQKMTRLAAEKTALANENNRLAAEAQERELVTRQNLYAADINLAQQTLFADNLREARALLQNQIPKPGQSDLRGFEWRYLWQQCHSEELFSLPAQTNGAYQVAFSPDGRWLATGGKYGSTKICDVTSRREIASLPGTGEVQSISFSPKGDLLVTASSNSVSLWDGRDFTLRQRLLDAGDQARFSPDGRYLLTSGVGRLILWNLETWRATSSLETPESWKHPWMDSAESWVAFSPDGGRVAVMCADAIRLLSIPDFRETSVIAHRLSSGASARPLVKFSPDNKMLAILGTSGLGVRLWNIANQREHKILTGHSAHVLAASFSPDGSRLATCGSDQTIRLWNVATGELIRKLRGQADVVTDVAFSPDGKMLASVGGYEEGKMIRLWDANTDSARDYFREPSAPVGFNRQGGIVAFGEKLNPVVIDPVTLQVTNTAAPILIEGRAVVLRMDVIQRKDPSIREPWYDPYLGNLSPNGWIVGLRERSKQSIDIWDLRENKLLCSIGAVKPWIAFAPGRQLLATDTTNATTTVWQLPSGTSKWVFTNRVGLFQAIAFSPDENFIVTDEGTRLKLWRIEEDEVKSSVTFHPKRNSVIGLTYSPDGSLLATGEEGGPIKLWAMPSTQSAGVLSGHTQSVISLAFSPDGRTLASMCDDRTVRFWHVATRRELLRFHAPKEDHNYFSLAFSPDGRALVARRVDDQGAITWVWHAPSLAEIAQRTGTE